LARELSRRLSAQELVDWAVEALSAGADGSALVALASLDVGGTPVLADARPLFGEACAELGLDLPADAGVIHRTYLSWIADGVRSRTLDRLDAAELIHKDLLPPLGHPASLWDWQVLCERMLPQLLPDFGGVPPGQASLPPPKPRRPHTAVTATQLAVHDLLVRCDKPEIELTPADSSPCILGEPDEFGSVRWMPVELTDPPDFSALERALGAPVHGDVLDLFSSYLAGPVECRHSQVEFVLMFGWNQSHLRTIIQQAARHVRKALRAHAGPLVPIACTIDYVWIAVHNATGEVWLQEEPHLPPERPMASSVAQFLSECTHRPTRA
jgi:SecY interacting protein Syd